jgi:cephalosporin-C deacetylase-like acetyl esterase
MHKNQIKLPKASVIHLMGVHGKEKPIFELLRLKPTIFQLSFLVALASIRNANNTTTFLVKHHSDIKLYLKFTIVDVKCFAQYVHSPRTISCALTLVLYIGAS